MLTKAVLAATAMAVVAACGASADDESAADSTPDQTAEQTSSEDPTQAVEGTLCSEVGVASEGFDAIALYIVEQPVEDTLVVDQGVACAIASSVSGDVIVKDGEPSVAILNPGGVVAGDIRVSGQWRLAGLEDREGTSGELGPPTLEGDLLCDQCSGVFAIPGTIAGNVDIVGLQTGGQTEFNGAAIGGDVTMIDSAGGASVEGEALGPQFVNSDIAGSVTLTGTFGRSPVLDGTHDRWRLVVRGQLARTDRRRRDR